MRNISFMLTTDQIKERTKTVTRRTGWAKLVPGQLLRGVEKGMGLKAGETVKELAIIRVVSVRPEPLNAMINDLDYGFAECEKRGLAITPPCAGQHSLSSSFATRTADVRRKRS